MSSCRVFKFIAAAFAENIPTFFPVFVGLLSVQVPALAKLAAVSQVQYLMASHWAGVG